MYVCVIICTGVKETEFAVCSSHPLVNTRQRGGGNVLQKEQLQQGFLCMYIGLEPPSTEYSTYDYIYLCM